MTSVPDWVSVFYRISRDHEYRGRKFIKPVLRLRELLVEHITASSTSAFILSLAQLSPSHLSSASSSFWALASDSRRLSTLQAPDAPLQLHIDKSFFIYYSRKISSFLSRLFNCQTSVSLSSSRLLESEAKVTIYFSLCPKLEKVKTYRHPKILVRADPNVFQVARIVSYIHKHLVGKTLAVVKAQHDENVFGKVGTTAAEFEKALMGKKILDAGQQGKYFWYAMGNLSFK